MCPFDLRIKEFSPKEISNMSVGNKENASEIGLINR